MQNHTWRIKTKNYSKKSSNWVAEVLAKNRGLNTKKQLDDFLNPSLAQILKIKLTDTHKAVQRIIRAIDKKEKVIVYSDYDADGICGSAIMWETLFDLGADVLPYVPHRINEGYGFYIPSIEKLASNGVSLIITVDHGVTAVKQIEAAKKLGIDVIITDHHLLPKDLPKPYALVHSVQLCGAGVAFRFCFDLVAKLKPSYKQNLINKLELAAIATIADLVPLTGANRTIVKLGLEILNPTARPGLKSLIKESNINYQIGTYEIGHILAPRINAMGRIEHGMDALRLICAKNEKSADELARLLSKTNTKRQDLTTSAITQAIGLVIREHLVGVVSHTSWHEGVIGLVASRLVEAHHKPMVVISRGEQFSKGSARSIPGFNIVDAIRDSSEYLVDAGGHPMAAGFTIETRHIETFSRKINAYAQGKLTEDLLEPVINIECELEKNDINTKTLSLIETFEPYGVANPKPIFLTRGILVEDVRGVGQGAKHLKLELGGIGAIGFNLGEERSRLRPGYLIDAVYTIDEDKFNGGGKVQMKIKDFKIAKS